jgi:hypothetical protein
LEGETEELGENLPQCRFVHHKPHMLPGRKPGSPQWEVQRLTAWARPSDIFYKYFDFILSFIF